MQIPRVNSWKLNKNNEFNQINPTNEFKLDQYIKSNKIMEFNQIRLIDLMELDHLIKSNKINELFSWRHFANAKKKVWGTFLNQLSGTSRVAGRRTTWPARFIIISFKSQRRENGRKNLHRTTLARRSRRREVRARRPDRIHVPHLYAIRSPIEIRDPACREETLAPVCMSSNLKIPIHFMETFYRIGPRSTEKFQQFKGFNE